MKPAVIIFFLLPVFLFAQNREVRGTISDSSTRKPLPYASILLSGTTRGAISNSDGEFTFKLRPGRHSFIIKYVGYRTDTVNINVPLNEKIVINLVKQPVLLPEVLVTSEDPAYRIIREAIKRKRINRKGLENYEYGSYIKNVIRSEGDIALVQEMIIKGYRLKDKKTREFILETHRTVNQKKIPNFNMAEDLTDKHLPDFSADTLTLLMNTVYLPIADNAFGYYDYKLLKTIQTDNAPVYEIRVIPRSSIQPLLEGIIYIEGEDYSIVKVDLKASEGVRFPYVHNLNIEFKQSLNKYAGYRLPVYFEMNASMSFNFGGLIGLAPFSLHEVNSITDYKINQPVPDSVKKAVKSGFGGFVADTSRFKIPPKEISSEEMKKLRPVPLTGSEIKAFATIDTTMTLEKSIKITGALAGLVPKNPNENKNSGTDTFGQITGILFNYVYVNNNRVENFSFGARYNSDIFGSKFYTDSYAAYSTGIKNGLGSFSLGYKFHKFFLKTAELQAFKTVRGWQSFSPYSQIINSASVLLGYEDYYNYYMSTGFRIGITKKFRTDISAGLDFISDKESSLKERKFLSIINRRRTLRVNPFINEGFDRKIRLSLQFGNSPLSPQIIPSDGLTAGIDISRPFLQSDFDYYKLYFAGQLRMNTMYPELFLSPYLKINLEAEYIDGTYGIQRTISPVSAMGFYSPSVAFKGLRPYQFVGDKMIAFHIEHNWRTIIFQSLGLNFLTNSDLDLITGAAVLRIYNDSGYMPMLTQKKPYWEVYAGISRIMGLIKLECGYNSLNRVTVTFAVAPLF